MPSRPPQNLNNKSIGFFNTHNLDSRLVKQTALKSIKKDSIKDHTTMLAIKQPVIFIHTGNPSYLRLSIEQAKFYDNEVIVLGDQLNKRTCLKSKVIHK